MFSRFAIALLTLICCLSLEGHQTNTPPDVGERKPMQNPDASPNDSGTDITTPAPITCPAGGPIGAVNLTVISPGKEKEPLPFRTIIHLSEGDTVLYDPILRGREKRNGEISLVLVPQKRDPKGDGLLVTDPKPADKPQQWKIEQTMSIAAYVYGPEGLSKRKVKGFLSRDELLISQLADYAEKTSQTEALIEALSNANSSSASVNSALSGFASQYGVTVPLDKTSPPAVQAQTLFSTINPQLASYDPLTSSAGSRISQTASLTTAAASLFFGSPVGLAAGGTAMLIDLHALAFPGTQFRSSFAQPLPNGINLCGERTPAPPHTRVAYIWANRIPNAKEPDLHITHANNIPPAEKTPVPVTLPDKDWKYLDRARKWTLESASSNGNTTATGSKTDIKVLKLTNQKSLELDLSGTKLPPGEYRLNAFWDWDHFVSAGSIFIRPLSDFSAAQLEPSAQDRVLAKGGKVPVTLQKADFEFTTKVEIKQLGDEFATAQSIPFLLPKGLREGPQNSMDVQINTADLNPGNYQLLVSQGDDKKGGIPVKVLPNPPEFDNWPILTNQGVPTQHYLLKGKRLALVSQLSSPGADLELGAPEKDGDERPLTVHLKTDDKPNQTFPVTAKLQDRSEPVTFPNALKITGPLPTIASAKLSAFPGGSVSLNPGEWPAGETLSASLDVRNINAQSTVRLSCHDNDDKPLELHIGEQTDQLSLQQLSPDQLFLSVNTQSLPAGCALEARIDNGAEGASGPYHLATMLRLPHIDELSADSETAQDTKTNRPFTMLGHNLEMLGKVGWDPLNGQPVTDLPAPVPGRGQLQSLKVMLPDPPKPAPQIFVWLRGEKTGRLTPATLTPAKDKRTAPSTPTAPVANPTPAAPE